MAMTEKDKEQMINEVKEEAYMWMATEFLPGLMKSCMELAREHRSKINSNTK